MKKSFFLLILFSQIVYSNLIGQTSVGFKIEWNDIFPEGKIEVVNGKCRKIEIDGKGKVNGNFFSLTESKQNPKLIVTIDDVNLSYGLNSTIIRVKTKKDPFSFFLRDINASTPIYIAEYGVIVTADKDDRSFSQIVSNIHEKGLKRNLQIIESESEESFENASKHDRQQHAPIWLGLSRDVRTFELKDWVSDPNLEMYSIKPRNNNSKKFGEIEYGFVIGRGQGVERNLSRSLEDGFLPILNTTIIDGEIEYRSKSFVALENSPLTADSLQGTDFLVAQKWISGLGEFSKQLENLYESIHESEERRMEKNKSVLYHQTIAINKSDVPRYAWFKTIRPGSAWWQKSEYTFNKSNGFSQFSSDEVFGISKLNGMALHEEEVAILIKPNDSIVFEFFLPHSPINQERAALLSKVSYERKLHECKNFWLTKLSEAAKIEVPEERINNMIRTGLLHLDLITFGKEPDGVLAPCVGVYYPPIGTESSPIIQFYNSMGLHDTALRSLMYFIKNQRGNGMFLNFGGYMIETGAVLWSIGEYYRYTKNVEWIKSISKNLLLASDFLLKWRNDNKKGNLKESGYGMIDGKVADPDTPYHQFMLNAYGYIGICRLAEIFSEIDEEKSRELKKQAQEWKHDILTSLNKSISESPVIPLKDGTWNSSIAPWTENSGLSALSNSFFTHGTVTAYDVLLGPLYLVFCEVLTPDHPFSKMMLNYITDLFLQRNAAFSQPYYSRHNWIQLKLGMVKPFLKTYYNTFCSVADPDTYTFWEHTYRLTPHKTHEEAWFLMETRWMLYLEEDDGLSLLKTIPRKWMENGGKIRLKDVATYYGPMSLDVTSHIDNGYIEAAIQCKTSRKLKTVSIRIPHPNGEKPIKVVGGLYDKKTETIKIEPFNGNAKIIVYY